MSQLCTLWKYKVGLEKSEVSTHAKRAGTSSSILYYVCECALRAQGITFVYNEQK